MPLVRCEALFRALMPVICITSFAPHALAQEAEPEESPPTALTTPSAPAPPTTAVTSTPPPPPMRRAPQASVTTVSGPPTVAKDEGWKFEFHGYLRAPMMVGVGRRDNPLPGQSATTFHSPIIPDGQYLSWQSSPHNKSDWAELYVSVGNSLAKGTVSLRLQFLSGFIQRRGEATRHLRRLRRPDPGPRLRKCAAVLARRRVLEQVRLGRSL